MLPPVPHDILFPEGEFDHDLIHGEGLWSWPDGSSYAGQTKHGVREGKGFYVTAMRVSEKTKQCVEMYL